MPGDKPLPSITSYRVSFQKDNPRKWFRDSDLYGCKAETDDNGLPRIRGGNFGGVFRVTGADGRREWAVKCFNKRVPDLEGRYAAISRELAKTRHHWQVGFEFHAEGIFNPEAGRWMPTLKMEWVSGPSLGEWIARHLDDRIALGQLALEFIRVVDTMERAGIAHGDLQHGNIIVQAGPRIRLIDYDGMYVAGLHGYPMRESGLAHYQAPGRPSKAYFGPASDRFAARVIYLSLLALAAEPELWHRLHEDGGEYLLLKRADFVEPGSSEAFRELAASPDGRVGAELAQLRRDLELDPERIPALDLSQAGLAAPAGRGGQAEPKIAGLPAYIAANRDRPLTAGSPGPEAPEPDTSAPESSVPEVPPPGVLVPELPVPELPVPVLVPEVLVPEPPVPELPVPEVLVPEVPVPAPAGPQPSVPEPFVPEPLVPETAVPAAAAFPPRAPSLSSEPPTSPDGVIPADVREPRPRPSPPPPSPARPGPPYAPSTPYPPQVRREPVSSGRRPGSGGEWPVHRPAAPARARPEWRAAAIVVGVLVLLAILIASGWYLLA